MSIRKKNHIYFDKFFYPWFQTDYKIMRYHSLNPDELWAIVCYLNVDHFLRKSLVTTPPRGYAIIFPISKESARGKRLANAIYQTVTQPGSKSDLMVEGGALSNTSTSYYRRISFGRGLGELRWPNYGQHRAHCTHRFKTNNNNNDIYFSYILNIARYSQIIIISITQRHIIKSCPFVCIVSLRRRRRASGCYTRVNGRCRWTILILS